MLDSDFHHLVRHCGSADELHHDIHFGIPSHIRHVTTDLGIAIIVVGVISTRTNMRHTHFPSAPRSHERRLILQDIDCGKPHGSHTTHTDS